MGGFGQTRAPPPARASLDVGRPPPYDSGAEVQLERFQIEGEAGRSYAITIEEADARDPHLANTLIDIDLQTFSEPTFSHFTASAMLRHGRVYLLVADGIVIGTCVNVRSWERPNEVLLLSMGIRPGWRGRGLGQRFLAGVLDRLRKKGIRGVSLLVSEDNRRAARVYEDVGFVNTGERFEDPRTGECLVSLRVGLAEDPVAAVELG